MFAQKKFLSKIFGQKKIWSKKILVKKIFLVKKKTPALLVTKLEFLTFFPQTDRIQETLVIEGSPEGLP